MVLHSVFFYLKNTSDDLLIHNLQQAILNDLGSIKSVRNIYAGAPLGVDREVVDNDYSMSLHAFFDDREGMNAYLKDSIHLAFLDKFKSSWDHINVCDTYLE